MHCRPLPRPRRRLAAAIWLLLALVARFRGAESLVIEEATSETSFYGNAALTTHQLTFRNDDAEAVDVLQWALPAATGDARTVPPQLELSTSDASGKSSLVKVELISEDDDGERQYRIRLPQPVAASGGRLSASLRVAEFHALRAWPKQARYSEHPFVVYVTSAYLYAPYAVERQSRIIKLPSDVLSEQITSPQPVELRRDALHLGPYENTTPSHQQPIRIRVRCKEALLALPRYVKRLRVSHWGAVEVEEEMTLLNAGAAVSGEFARMDHLRLEASGLVVNAASSLWITLPSHATEVYYKDLNGNITTSHLRAPTRKGRALQLTFRHLLLGGWRTYFRVGYTLAAKYALRRHGESFALRTNMQTASSRPLPIDDATVELTLPEGATEIEFGSPVLSEVESAVELHAATLAYGGRRTLRLRARGVLAHAAMHSTLYVRYRVPAWRLLTPVAVIASALAAAFGAAMICSRLQLSLRQDAAGEAVSSALYLALSRLSKLEDALSAAHERLRRALSRAERGSAAAGKATAAAPEGAADGLATAQLDFDRKCEAYTRQLKATISELETMDGETVLRLRELQQLQEQRQRLVARQISAGKAAAGGAAEAERSKAKLVGAVAAVTARIDVAVAKLLQEL